MTTVTTGMIFLGVLSTLFVTSSPGARENPDIQLIFAAIAAISFALAYYATTV